MGGSRRQGGGLRQLPFCPPELLQVLRGKWGTSSAGAGLPGRATLLPPSSTEHIPPALTRNFCSPGKWGIFFSAATDDHLIYSSSRIATPNLCQTLRPDGAGRGVRPGADGLRPAGPGRVRRTGDCPPAKSQAGVTGAIFRASFGGRGLSRSGNPSPHLPEQNNVETELFFTVGKWGNFFGWGAAAGKGGSSATALLPPLDCCTFEI